MSECVEVVPVVDVDRPTECGVADCSRPPRWRGLCQRCYSRQWKAERRGPAQRGVQRASGGLKVPCPDGFPFWKPEPLAP